MANFAAVQRYQVGNFTITYLPDGGGLIAPTVMYPASSAPGWQKYSHLFDEQGRLVVSIGGFLIETSDQKIIMDLGFGPATVDFPGFGPFMGGKFLESLAQTGVDRTAITDVVYSHLHLDHVGWTSLEENGERRLTFPNARHLCTQTEWNFWQGDQSGLGPNPVAVVQPLQDVIQFINPGDSLAPDITVLNTPGHTPGHISLRLDAGETQVYLIVDLLHSEVQFYEPTWSVVFDIDPALARQSRENIYSLIAQPNVIVGDGHFANQVFGRLSGSAGNWVWSPL